MGWWGDVGDAVTLGNSMGMDTGTGPCAGTLYQTDTMRRGDPPHRVKIISYRCNGEGVSLLVASKRNYRRDEKGNPSRHIKKKPQTRREG